MMLQEFFSTHPIFDTKELKEYLAQQESQNKWTRKALLDHHVKRGNIIRLRKGLYYTVPYGSEPESVSVDPWLVTSKLSDDAVISHHSALGFFGKTYSESRQFTYFSARWKPKFEFRSYEFNCVSLPEALQRKNKGDFGVKKTERGGVKVAVTTLERTLVDLMDRPEWGISWEEIWRSLMSVEYFNMNIIRDYVLLLENSTTTAKTAFFLDAYSKEWDSKIEVPIEMIEALPKQPIYMDRKYRGGSVLVSKYNLIVPSDILEQKWRADR